MRCAHRASNGPDHLGLCALQAGGRPLQEEGRRRKAVVQRHSGVHDGTCVRARHGTAPHGGSALCFRPPLQCRRLFLRQSCVKFDTDHGEEVWEGCGKMGKGLEGPKSQRHQCQPADGGVGVGAPQAFQLKCKVGEGGKASWDGAFCRCASKQSEGAQPKRWHVGRVDSLRHLFGAAAELPAAAAC